MRNVELGLSNLRLITIFLVLTLMQLLIGTLRTYILMQFNNHSSYTLNRILSITWASSFINCIAPSALFGEAFRVKELLTVDPALTKDNTFYALGFSKLFSVGSLILITVVASLLVHGHPVEIQWFLHFLYVCCGVGFIFFLLRRTLIVFLRPLYGKAYDVTRFKFFRNRLENFKKYHLSFIEENRNISWVILLSMIIQVLNTISFLVIIYTLNPGLNFSLILDLTYVIPLGIIAMTLPISISGLGIGHLAFSRLLGMFGIMSGADIFTIYFAYSYIFNFIGVVPFIMLQRKRS